jgi:hypothetical protein
MRLSILQGLTSETFNLATIARKNESTVSIDDANHVAVMNDASSLQKSWHETKSALGAFLRPEEAVALSSQSG